MPIIRHPRPDQAGRVTITRPRFFVLGKVRCSCPRREPSCCGIVGVFSEDGRERRVYGKTFRGAPDPEQFLVYFNIGQTPGEDVKCKIELFNGGVRNSPRIAALDDVHFRSMHFVGIDEPPDVSNPTMSAEMPEAWGELGSPDTDVAAALNNGSPISAFWHMADEGIWYAVWDSVAAGPYDLNVFGNNGGSASRPGVEVQ